jgi:hypothetical protein
MDGTHQALGGCRQPPRPIALSLVLIVATMIAGLAIRFIPLNLPSAVVKYGGSMLWALMIYWIVSSLLSSLRLVVAALLTVAITTLIEFFKLYHSSVLDAFRLTTSGILLLGRFFSVWDIFAYWLAIFVGLLIDQRIRPAANLTSFPEQGGI